MDGWMDGWMDGRKLRLDLHPVAVLKYNIYSQVHITKQEEKHGRISNNEKHNITEEYSNTENIP
jgi:hypothetical protein